MRAAFVHVVGDLLQSVSVLVSAIIIFFKVSSLSRCAHWLKSLRECRNHAGDTSGETVSRALDSSLVYMFIVEITLAITQVISNK